jgi:hypothetical protein
MTSETQQISRPFLEDYVHFESIHAKYPNEATSVFARVDDLRVALQVFRESTNVSELPAGKVSPVPEAALLQGLELNASDGSAVLLASADIGSTDEALEQIDAACACVASAAG